MSHPNLPESPKSAALRVALSQVHLRDPVPVPEGGALESTFPPGNTRDYKLTWATAEGVVIIARGGKQRIVPLSNVRAMTPAEAPTPPLTKP